MIRTENLCHFIHDVGLETRYRRSDHNDGRDADDDPDQSQKRAQLMFEDRFDRDPEGI